MHRDLPGGIGPVISKLAAVAAVLFLAASSARAQDTPSPLLPGLTPADTVSAVAVEGNTSVDADLVRRGFGVPVGSRYSIDAVRAGIRRLYDLGFFSDIVVEGDHEPGSIALTIRVVENPKVGAVEYTGNKKIKQKDLDDAVGQVKGKMADDRLLSQVERSLDRIYEKKGYTRIHVRPRYLPGDSENRRILLVEIQEGPKVRVEQIRFEGLHRAQASWLKKAMKQGTTGFLKGGVYHPEVVEDDMKRIEDALATHGFRDGKVVDHEVVPGSKDDRVVVQVSVDEGPLYYTGSVHWEGNKAIPTPALYNATKVTPGEVFNQEKVRETVAAAQDLYAEVGYLYLSIQPDFTTADSTVDVSFKVMEGAPSHIHDITISGNTRTKERVIRRQLSVRPGDLFRRSALVRSDRELRQLGYFSDVRFNTQPADSSDINLLLDVDEKQVGTASAGFGFSSSVGLTGFMELGHTNLFGNGQQLNLRMERGSNRNNADLSFTEPWFKGTPTSVGVELFTTNNILRGPDLDLNILRSGGALRVGRPLPLAYTRIYTSYRLENQRVVDQTGSSDNQTVGQSTYLTGFRLDQQNSLSSSLSLTLLRNSTDHPLYPTVGSKEQLQVTLSGGPLGGDQVFQKYEVDVSHYLKTVDLGGWKPILMLRSRLGALAEGFRTRDLTPTATVGEPALEGAVWDTMNVGLNGKVVVPVPWQKLNYPTESSELFRLGGTTYDALRGYDDFEVVPDGNIQRRFTVVQTTVDTLGTKIYGVTPSNVFYPGGRYMMVLTGEWQFPIAEPLHGLFFGDLGGTWNGLGDFRWNSLHRSLGVGLRMEVPLLGLIGFDYGYGFDRLDRTTGRYDRGAWQPHIQFGRIF